MPLDTGTVVAVLAGNIPHDWSVQTIQPELCTFILGVIYTLLARVVSHLEDIIITASALKQEGFPTVLGCHSFEVLEVCPTDRGDGLVGRGHYS